MNELTIYLAGEIRAPWRDELRALLASEDLPAHIAYVGRQELHDRSYFTHVRPPASFEIVLKWTVLSGHRCTIRRY